VLGADFHNADLVVNTSLSISVSVGSAHLVFTDFLVATTWDEVGNKGHVLAVFHVRLTHRTILVAQRFVLTVRVPFVMGLVMSVILLERIVQVTIEPVELRNDTQVERHLSVIIGCIVVTCTDRVNGLVGIGVDNLVSPVIVRLLPEVLGEV